VTAPDAAEYALLASRIGAAYPSYRINEATLVDWTERLAEVDDIDHATRMANRLRNLPSPPDPKDWQLARRDTREVEYVRALPAGPPEPMDDATRERWEAVKAKLREKPVGRSFPPSLDSLTEDDIKPKFVLRRDMLCGGTGAFPVVINGVRCCPDCEEPIPEEPSEVGLMKAAIRKAPRPPLMPRTKRRVP
jgi:hypothetical protein